MLIVSKFHDYYDTASVYGVDKEYVYQRETKEVSVAKKGWQNYWPYEEKYEKTKAKTTTKYFVHKRVIGFCGNIYPVIVIDKVSETTNTPPKTTTERLSFYSTDKVNEFFDKEKVDLEEKYGYWSMRGFSVKSSKSMDHFFAGSEFKNFNDKFQEHKCPIFIYGRFPEDGKPQGVEKLILNPQLKEYKFGKVKDSVSAFQDIYMFLAGVLCIPTMKMPEFTDKQKAQAKGHDGKYSFRKPPGKRGKKKWR